MAHRKTVLEAGGLAAAAADAGAVEADTARPAEGADSAWEAAGAAGAEADADADGVNPAVLIVVLLEMEVCGLGGSEATILQLAQAALISLVSSFG